MVKSICENTNRYVVHFEDAADSLLPPPTVVLPERDVFDMLQVHPFVCLPFKVSKFHIYQESRVQDPNGPIVDERTLPPGLGRRFEVIFSPLSKIKARKLREVMSAGMHNAVEFLSVVLVKPKLLFRYWPSCKG